MHTYLLSKLLLLHRESNAFIVGSATNLVGAYGVSAENTEDESHVFDFKSAGKAFVVGIVSLVCVPVLLTLYLLAVAPAAIVTLLVRSISQFAAEEGSRPQKAGNLLMLLLLLPLILLAIALGIAVSPFLSVLPAQRAYLMRSFVGGFRGILRVVLLADFKITKILHQTDDVLRLSTLPEALWEAGLSDQQEEGGGAGPLGKLPRRDTTDRTDIDPMAEHVAAQMQARVYGVRGTMSAAAKAKAARLAAEGAVDRRHHDREEEGERQRAAERDGAEPLERRRAVAGARARPDEDGGDDALGRRPVHLLDHRRVREPRRGELVVDERARVGGGDEVEEEADPEEHVEEGREHAVPVEGGEEEGGAGGGGGKGGGSTSAE